MKHIGKKYKKKEKKKLFLRKNEKKQMKNIKKSKNEEMKKKKKTGKKTKNGRKKVGKKRKEGMFFYIRTVMRNRNEIEAQKKSDFEHPIKTKKMKENERE